MEVVYRRCCGIDVHKDFITACVLVNEPGKQREVRKKEFRTYWSDLQKLKLWLYASKVERVAMESTGVYWKPVWNVLEGHFPLLLANPYHMRNIPGQKTPERQRVDQRSAGPRPAAAQFRAPTTDTGVERSDSLSGETHGRTQPNSWPDREDPGRRQREARISGQRHSGGDGPARH